jgi:hypothetical protein
MPTLSYRTCVPRRSSSALRTAGSVFISTLLDKFVRTIVETWRNVLFRAHAQGRSASEEDRDLARLYVALHHSLARSMTLYGRLTSYGHLVGEVDAWQPASIGMHRRFIKLSMAVRLHCTRRTRLAPRNQNTNCRQQ